MAPKAAGRLVEEHHPELADDQVERVLGRAAPSARPSRRSARWRRRPRSARSPRQLHAAAPRCRHRPPRPPGATAAGQGDGQCTAATADVADPLARPGVDGLRAGTASPPRSAAPAWARPRPTGRRSIAWPPPRWPRATRYRPARFGPCASASSSCPPTAGPWPAGQWEWADDAGFRTAWTYDHIRWGGMPDGPWHAAVPVLAAAAAVTRRVRLGTLVATPNFRHPVTLARDALALDDLSERPPRPRARARAARDPTPRRSGRSRGRRRSVWPASRSSSRCSSRSSTASPATRTSLRTAHYAADEAPSTPGRRAAPAPAHHRRRRRRRAAAGRAHGTPWVTIGPTGTRTAHPRRDPRGGCVARSSAPRCRLPSGRP